MRYKYSLNPSRPSLAPQVVRQQLSPQAGQSQAASYRQQQADSGGAPTVSLLLLLPLLAANV